MTTVEILIEKILQLDERERIEFIKKMKKAIADWKERIESELKWMQQLEKMGFK